MKITKVKPLICDAYRMNWVFVKVITDSGIYGVGEATLEYHELSVAKAIEEIITLACQTEEVEELNKENDVTKATEDQKAQDQQDGAQGAAQEAGRDRGVEQLRRPEHGHRR